MAAATTGKTSQRIRVDLKKNDVVRVVAGRDKGKEGRVLFVDRESGKVLVEHVQMMKKHVRPNPARQIKGGIAERETPIAVSNVMVLCGQCGPTRIGHTVDKAGGKARRTRVCRKCGQPLERK